MAFLLKSNEICILRYISPKTRSNLDYNLVVPNIWLAKKGIAIGNDLDIEGSKYHVGNWIPVGKLPVYLVGDDSDKEYYLRKNDWLNPPGSVAYFAWINLSKVKVGMNIAFETDLNKESRTLLTIAKTGDGYNLTADTNLNLLDDKIKKKLDSNARLITLNGEFFLDNYNNITQLRNEMIYKSDGRSFLEITSDIMDLR